MPARASIAANTALRAASAAASPFQSDRVCDRVCPMGMWSLMARLTACVSLSAGSFISLPEFAAMLARGGISGPAPVFEGRRGFFQLVAGPADVDIGTFGRRDIPFRIHHCGMKAYPAVVYAQTAIVAGIALAKDIGDLDRIAAIEIATTRRGPPANRERAREMGAGHKGHGGSQLAVHHGPGHVRRRYQQ